MLIYRSIRTTPAAYAQLVMKHNIPMAFDLFHLHVSPINYLLLMTTASFTIEIHFYVDITFPNRLMSKTCSLRWVSRVV
jgi:hypothetical protein